MNNSSLTWYWVTTGLNSVEPPDQAVYANTFDIMQIPWETYFLKLLAQAILILALGIPIWVCCHAKTYFPPIASNDRGNTSCDQSVNITILTNDFERFTTIDPTSVVIEQCAGNGIATPSPETGIVTYTPNPGFVGKDWFSYSVMNKSGGRSNRGRVMVTVNP